MLMQWKVILIIYFAQLCDTASVLVSAASCAAIDVRWWPIECQLLIGIPPDEKQVTRVAG